MSNLVKVDVHGDTLEAVLDEEGTPWVSILRVCEVLGISPQPQQEKLKEAHWASTTIIVAVAADGKARPILCISLDTLASWLSHIHPLKVAAHKRPKIILFQKECVRVLGEHFFGHRSAALVQAPAPFPMEEFCARMVTMVESAATAAATAAVTALVPQILATYDNRLALVERQTAENLNAVGVVGYEPGKDIRRRIRLVAKLRVLDDSPKAFKSEISRVHVLLRRLTQHQSSWCLLPTTKLVSLNEHLEAAEIEAMRVRKQLGIDEKQLSLHLKLVKGK